MIFKNANGRVVEQRDKDSHSQEIAHENMFLGHRFLLKTKLYGDKRCIYCGKWFHWSDSDAHKWIKTENIDHMNKDGALEPLHCSSDHCDYFHIRYLNHVEKLKKQKDQQKEEFCFELWRDLKKQGLVQ